MNILKAVELHRDIVLDNCQDPSGSSLVAKRLQEKSFDDLAHDLSEDYEIVPHILWMLDEIPSLSEDKANRWLGFIQGWMWSFNLATINQLMEIVKACS